MLCADSDKTSEKYLLCKVASFLCVYDLHIHVQASVVWGRLGNFPVPYAPRSFAVRILSLIWFPWDTRRLGNDGILAGLQFMLA